MTGSSSSPLSAVAAASGLQCHCCEASVVEPPDAAQACGSDSLLPASPRVHAGTELAPSFGFIEGETLEQSTALEGLAFCKSLVRLLIRCGKSCSVGKNYRQEREDYAPDRGA